MKYEYYLETFSREKWLKILTGTMHYCQGFLDAKKDYAPHNAHRLMRSDGKIIEEVAANDEVNLGQIAGWPTAEQYEFAANNALACAKSIRDRTLLNNRRIG